MNQKANVLYTTSSIISNRIKPKITHLATHSIMVIIFLIATMEETVITCNKID